jgi:hypothetical protein
MGAMGKDFFLHPSFQHSIIPFFQRLIRSIFGSERNYGCLPEDTGTPHPEQRAGNHASNRTESANSIEKEASLR